MAKMTIDGNVFEGTTEELRAIFDMMGVKFPTQEDAKPTPQTEKRKANVGERILIKDAAISFGDYSNGDIFTVARQYKDVGVIGEGQGSDDAYIAHREYEVIVEPTQAKPETPKAPADLITHNGADYTLVDRKAQPGDVVVFTANENRFITNGKVYGPVTRGGLFLGAEDNDGDNISVYNEGYNRTEANVLVYEKVVAVEPHKVGDYVKVIEMPTIFNKLYKAGEIVQITKVDYSDIPYEAKGVNSEETRWFRKAQVVKATDAEVEQALAGAVFTKLGRNPGEYKEGDIVRGYSIKRQRDVIGIIEDVGDKLIGVRDDVNDYHALNNYELIAPVESRVDTK